MGVERAAVEAHELRYRYEGGVEALRGVSLRVPAGQLFALLGPNGAGKTTLVHILCTLIPPVGGDARVAGYSVTEEPGRVRRQLGLVFQEPSLDERLTVWENLDFHARIYGVPRREAARRINELLELVELSTWRHAPARQLSRGMKRRLEVARAMVHRPSILVLDEPTVGLDVPTRTRLWQYLDRLRRHEGVTLFLTTHSMEEAEAAEQVVILDEGRAVAEGAPDELRHLAGGDTVMLRVDEEGEAEIKARWSAHLVSDGEWLTLKVDRAERFFESFMPQYGGRVKWVEVRRPSLESVFMTLTGKRLRDGPVDPREVLLAFGRRGGEHTR
ncbi:ABC transporter ATP-binding protein [Carboxydochorda subterranea]|uniref:ABC transporter ATP-binding protein n=1 Tax=Carboxydichorda subterranea TaxID=3109565 RepID=A0ABZ1BU93_9FIRM|nr:ABC transporter ATP-binding protein [Limnochorda sp. L945t]WRP16158.1 ABC transporter ATP-binding protein [Limnochorda sp. L945t]